VRRTARQRLGQHFLIDPVVAARLVDSLALDPERDVVIEIGPGRGALTEFLVGRCRRLLGVELDFRLASELQEKLGDREDAEVRHADFLELDLSEVDASGGRLRVVGNIPYSITSPVILKILAPENRGVLYDATLTVQLEVAQRVTATPGSKEYGVLSVLSQVLAVPQLLFRIPPRAFRPRPRVSSAVVRWAEFQPPGLLKVDERLFRQLVRTAFAQRRKMLRNGLLWLGEDALQMLRTSGWNLTRRPEELSPAEWVRLTRDAKSALRALEGRGTSEEGD